MYHEISRLRMLTRNSGPRRDIINPEKEDSGTLTLVRTFPVVSRDTAIVHHPRAGRSGGLDRRSCNFRRHFSDAGVTVEAPSRSQGNSQRQTPLGPKPARTDFMSKECLARLNDLMWVMRWRSPSRPSVRAIASSVSTSWAPSASEFLRNAVTRACPRRSFITCGPCDRAVYVQARTGVYNPLTAPRQFDILQSALAERD